MDIPYCSHVFQTVYPAMKAPCTEKFMATSQVPIPTPGRFQMSIRICLKKDLLLVKEFMMLLHLKIHSVINFPKTRYSVMIYWKDVTPGLALFRMCSCTKNILSVIWRICSAGIAGYVATGK